MIKLKKWLIAFTAVIAVAFSFAAVGCKKNKNVTLTYEVDGGTAIAAVSVAKGTEVELASAATKDGYEFDGWYLSSDLSGNKVTKVTVDDDMSVYAKWVKLYLATIEADVEVNTASVRVKAGEVLLTKLDGVSTTSSDYKIGEWQVDGKTIDESYVMPEKDITVKVKHKTKYVVKTYLENNDGNYEEQEAITDYAYVGSVPDKSFAEEGYKLVSEEGSVPVAKISDDISKNSFVLYYKRMDLTVTFEPNYPDDAEHGTAESKRISVKFGGEVSVPDDYTAEGYYLAGWSASSVGGKIDYAADYIYNRLYDKSGETPVNAKIMPSKNVVLFGVWVKGYKDMFGGSDYLYVSETEENTVYMSRENYFFKGTTYGTDGTDFVFRTPEGSLAGRILGDGLFGYRQDTTDEIYRYYIIGTGIIDGVLVRLDAYNGIELNYKDKISNGTYTIDDNGFLIVTYTEGELAGTTKMLYLTTMSDGTDVYLERNEEQYGLGLLGTYGIIGGKPAQYTLSVRLNGFGYAGIYISNTYRGTYAYTLNSTSDLLTINNVGTYKLTDYNGSKALFVYDRDEVKTYTSASGNVTLSTNGDGTATLTDSGTPSTGYYSIESSVFGGKILTYTSGSTSRIFLCESVESKDDNGETVTTYTLDEKAAGYAEYYFAYNTGAYYTPMFVLNDTATNHMTVYGRTVGGKFVKISDGTYAVTNGIYEYNRVNDYLGGVVIETETIEGGFRYYYTGENGEKVAYMTTPIDLKAAAKIKFGTHIGIYTRQSISGSSDTTVLVSYIYSINGSTDGFVTEYANGDDTLTLVSGIAIYDEKTSGKIYKGNYSISDDGIITITSGNAENYKNGGSNGKELKYLEINETEKTFVALTSAPYSIGVYYKNGTYSSTAERISFDGKGGATYTIKSTVEGEEDKVYTGKVTENGTSLTGGQVYTFTSAEKSFDYIVLTISNSYYFAMKGDYKTTLITEEGSTLELDGFGFGAKLDGVSGRYVVTSDEAKDGVRSMVIRFVDEDSTYACYFDINGNSVTKRGDEYGTYIQTDNNYFTGYYILFDGYGVAKVFTSDGIDAQGNVTAFVDENGTYELGQNGVYTVTFVVNGEEKITKGKLGILVLNSTSYKNFIVVHEEKVDLYVNGNDWSMIRLDNANGATRYSKKGVVDTGNYILITDSLIYFVSSDGSDACIYEIDTANKSAEMQMSAEFGYYTEDFQSLYFTEYGYALYNGSTMYFYTFSDDNKMTIYHQPEENEVYDTSKLNKYNFVEEDFGVYDWNVDTHEPKTFRGETYYYNSGATISFTRNKVVDGEATKADQSYPVSGGKDVKLYATALKFRPNGKNTFSAKAQVQFNGTSDWYSGTVVREKVGDKYETYFAIAAGEGVLRLYLDLTYSVDREGNSTSEFKITSLKRVVDAPSAVYLDSLYMAYMIDSMLGTNLTSMIKNTNGTVSIVHDYDVDGNEIVANMKITTNFLSGAGIKDINDRIIQLKDASIVYDATTKLYTVEFKVPAYEQEEGEETLPEHDEYTYKLYLSVGQHQYLTSYLGYTVAAFVRCQTFTTDNGYEVSVERLIYSESTNTYGGVYSLSVKKDGEAVTSATDLAIIKTTEKGVEVSVMVRTLDENKKITATKYYVITLEDEVSGDASDTTIKPYKSATVVVKDIQTVYAENGEDFVDIDGDKITVVYHGGYYAVEECEKSENGVYTVKISDTLSFKVTIADGKAQITEVESQAEEAA